MEKGPSPSELSLLRDAYPSPNITATEPAPEEFGPIYLQPQFHGNGAEYFRIWIVNILLTIVTLGIYSAWAKVRKRRYLYRNIEIDGEHFDYHANPINILYGRLILAGGFLLYLGGGVISPYLTIAGVVLLIIMMPWLLVRSLSFNLRNTSYRGIRFNFHRDYFDAYGRFFFAVALNIVTLGLAYPYVYHMIKDFIISNTSYGVTRARFEASPWDFYSIAIRTAGIYLGGVICAVPFAAIGSLGAIAMVAVIYCAAGLAISYFNARMFNITAKSTRIGNIKFYSSMDMMGLGFVYLTNLVTVIVTLGFATPWATIRLMRYKAQCLEIAAPTVDDINALTGDKAILAAEGAFGDAATDFFDFDIGL